MFTKIKEGFGFGLGFAFAFILLYSLYTFFVLPQLISTSFGGFEGSVYDESHLPDDVKKQLEEQASAPPKHSDFTKFHELPIDEKIKMASAIVIGEFEQAEDGRNKAVIKEFLKKEPGVEIYYNVGDELSFMSSYPGISSYDKSNDGFIVFFADSPAQIKSGMTYSGDRIAGLNDIPIKLFREKCGSTQ